LKQKYKKMNTECQTSHNESKGSKIHLGDEIVKIFESVYGGSDLEIPERKVYQPIELS